MQKNVLRNLPTCVLAPAIFMTKPLAAQTTKVSGDRAGLAMCKKIVQRHGGKFSVDSATGKGTTFFFTLPA